MKFSFRTFLFVLALAFAPSQVAAQKPQVERKVEPPRAVAESEDFALERRADAEPKALITLCISTGDVVVRGWDRSEVRARIEEAGSLRLLTPNVRPAPRVEVLVSEDKETELGSGDCGSTRTIELMVPRGSTVEVESRNGHVEVSDVAEARVRALSGDVDVRRVSQSVEVSCLSGDVSVTDSSGPMRVATVSGDVEARNVRKLSPGDNFEAKSTSGDVTLEAVTHGQVNGTAISGSVIYTGALARGGSYDFRTISGDVTLELPADSSFNLHAKVVVSGDIDTDFPVKMATGTTDATHVAPPATPQTTPPPDTPALPTPVPMPGPVIVVMPPQSPGRVKPGKVKVQREPSSARLDGTVGTGDAVVNISSFSGSLHLRKR
ncbi:MAG: hypothetical protein QOE46_361 [Acidobacteriota bacterium]|jgi:hypothetical protein|nr:hypothetical protein [Acidobacteriota bacterium]